MPPSRLWATNLLNGVSNGAERAIDVRRRGGPIRHRYPQQPLSAPRRGSQPGISSILNLMDDPFRCRFVADPNKDLIENHIVDDIDAIDGVQSFSEAASHCTAPVDDTLYSGTTETPQRCPRCESTSPPRRFHHEVASPEVSPLFLSRQVGGGVSHGRCVNFRPRAEGVARVVRNI